MTLILLTIAWTLGIILGRHLDLGPPLWGMLAAAGLAGSVLARRSKAGRLAAALWVAVALGGWRFAGSQPTFDASALAYYNDRGWVTIRGYVSAEPSVRDTYTQLELAAEEIELDGDARAVSGKLVLNLAHYPVYAYGDPLSVRGLQETPPVTDDFSYREYLASRGVHSIMRRAQVTLLPGQRGNPLLRQAFRLKGYLRQVIEAILPNPEAGLLSGVLLGLSHTLPDYLADAFRATGLTHIIVISGFNISLVAQAIMLASRRWLHRWAALWGSLAAIVLYGLFVGPSPPVVRAALMGSLFILGQLLGRKSHALTSLAASSLLMTLFNPLLLWSVSYQLSFVATLALIVLEPALAEGLQAWGAARVSPDDAPGWWRPVRDMLLATGAAQIATLPVIWYHFSQVSVISLLANVLVLPVQPPIVYLGGIVTALGALSTSLGRVAAWTVWPLLRYTIAVVQWLAGISWASITVPRLHLSLVWAFYGVIALGLVVKQRAGLRARLARLTQQPLATKLSLAVPALVAVLVWASVLILPDRRLHLYLLDVGQGDAILLRTAGGRAILVDGGPDPLLLTSRLGEILPFWQRRIDLVVATHADQDHLAGLIPVIERYRVSQVIESPTMGDSALSAQWHQTLAAAGLEPMVASRGMQILMGSGLRLEVLHPPAGVTAVEQADDNRNSVVLMVDAGRCRILLTADIDAETEASLLDEGLSLGATVLKVAHHGTDASSSEAFLSAVDPQVALVSVGEGNPFGHPAEGTLQRLAALGCQVFRTDLQGTIELVTDGQRYWIRPDRPQE